MGGREEGSPQQLSLELKRKVQRGAMGEKRQEPLLVLFAEDITILGGRASPLWIQVVAEVCLPGA